MTNSKIDLEINVPFQKAKVEDEVRAFLKSLDITESSFEIAPPINANSNAPFFNSKKTKLIIFQTQKFLLSQVY